MKFFYCLGCHDIQALHFEWRRCFCGESSGRYLEDHRTAEYRGRALALGLRNSELTRLTRFMREVRGTAHDSSTEFEMSLFEIPWTSKWVRKVQDAGT